MNLASSRLYFTCFVLAVILSAALTPVMRLIAIRLKILDRPLTEVKTHTLAVPYLGGVAVGLALLISLAVARLSTNFPTGTLRSLRGIFFGSLIIIVLGLVDDVVPRGLGYRVKFLIQFIAALCVMSFDIRIKFVSPRWLAFALTAIWMVGITNAINIIDIMDGLASGIGAIAAFGFLFISLPSEEIYVNFTAAALAGALLGFIPYNLSKRLKIFLGDTGSLLTGFVLAALSVGTAYTRVNNLGVFAPILILGLPLYDTLLVIYLRFQRGVSPFKGSKDHFALRLEKFGFFREEILVMSYAASLLLSFIAFEVTVVSIHYAMLIYALSGIVALALGGWLASIPIDP
ncbi:MAG TPA: MraY family glycosyltransferase [Elusimicrobiota bacterium]|nr:MraY family glycosyltransferase [Elusimicrobiota bacterium]